MPPGRRSRPSGLQNTFRRVKTAPNAVAFSVVRDLLREGRTVSVRVEGQSMLPFFRSGSVVRLRPLRPGDLKPGRVVLGETDRGHFVIHRILRVVGRTVELLGDGNVHGTERIPRERICGTVDCSRLHLALAHVWLWMRPVRPYPLWFLRRICRK